ncbi:MAG: hypothetical protein JF887_07690 [Candidatus Dormibacteraeota bacterium]|uniref:Uncharacterized protein n=1 Tax=Candidatus Amunia macphersoniae TaxID=3127014 RepID=A0A934KF27_9BACT|nr:hypothetical protein [Candidatus Dormibacteraeota bacterium]
MHQLIALWLAVGAVLGGLSLVSRLTTDPLDDPNPAYQRPGFLDVSGPPYPAAPLGAGLPADGSRSVIFFTRPSLEASLVAALETDPGLRAAARLVIVVCGRPLAPPRAAITAVAESPACPTAHLDRMRTPRDGGPPVGYAIVGPNGLVRYTTLDPEVATHLSEVETMTRTV